VEYRDGKPVQTKDLPLQIAASTGKDVRGVELTFLFRDGDMRHVLGNASPLINDSGEVVGAVAAFLDVSAQKRAEQELLAASRRKDEFLAMLGHELRNPLAPIQTGVDLLNTLAIDHPVFVRVKETISRQVRHLSRLVDDLLEVSRITEGKIELRRESIDCLAILRSTVDSCHERVSANAQQLDLAIPDEPAYIHGDPVRVTQIFANVLDNAVKYTPKGGRIRVAANLAADSVQVEVEDNGIGIAADFLPYVFNVFAQSDHTLGRSRGGLGLGLTIVKRLVELHGGSISVASQGVGKGTTFKLVLPLMANAAQAKPASRTGNEITQWQRRVLVVDDNVDAANSLALLLEMKGCEVRKAFNGEQALRLAHEFDAELVLLDIGLPDMDGYRLVGQLRAQPKLKGAVFSAVTGYGQERDRQKAREAGFVFHLTKPIKQEELAALMRTLAEPVDAPGG